MHNRGWMKGLVALVLVGVIAGCEPISEPWVKGDRLADERTRADDQQRELQRRLQRYGADQ